MSGADDDRYGGGYDDAYGRDYGDGGGSGQTRLRLPDGGDGYAPTRRARSALPGRNVITIVGVVVLLIAAIAFANRGGGSTKDSADSGSGAAAPSSDSTAPTGVKPVQGGTSGFARTQQGAQSAATNYAVALAGDGMFRTDDRHRIVRSVYDPAVAQDRAAELDKVYGDARFLSRVGLGADGSAPAGSTLVSRADPVGAKLSSYSNDSAKVAVWYSSLFGVSGPNSKNPVTESWYTNTFDLKWVEGDWRIVDFTQKDGPAPVGRDQAASSAKDMSKAVKDFGGFTYAR